MWRSARHFGRFLFTGLLLAAGHITLYADEMDATHNTREQPYRLTLYAENDGGGIGVSGDDRHYTAGQGLVLAHRPAWADRLAERLQLPADATAAGYLFRYELYTPEELLFDPPDPADRPYAAYMTGGVFWQREHKDSLDHVQLDLGLVGPSAKGEQIQSGFHDVFGGDDPKGWDSQLPDEFAWQWYLKKKWRVHLAGTPATLLWDPQARLGADQAPRVELFPAVGVALGSVHRNAEAGVTLRYALGLPGDFGPGRLHDPQSATGLPMQHAQVAQRRGWGGSVYTRAAGRCVWHNKFIDDADEVTPAGISPVESEEVVGECQLGATLTYHAADWVADCGYSITFRSDEFDGQDEANNFSALQARITFWR